MSTQVEGRLDFSVAVGELRMEGALHGAGRALTLEVDDPKLLGGSGAGPARTLAAGLAEQGLRLTITADRELVTLGVPRASFWHRRVTGSPHIEVASLRAAFLLLRLRTNAPDDRPLVPPATPLPLAPTFLRRRRRPTTTHDPDRGGYPRLALTSAPGARPTERPRVFMLGERTVLGSDRSCDVVLPGLQPRHAEIVRTDADEFVLRPWHPAVDVRVHGAVVLHEALLRTGTRIQLGGWTVAYAREEYADHGRPYGGRIGGELGRQRPQPPREALARRRG